jgi:hypothetical protein
MKNLLFTLFAIGLAGFAAIAATTAMLNAPVRPAYIGAPKSDKPAEPSSSPGSIPAPTGDKPAIPDADKPATPAPDAGETPAPSTPVPGATGGVKPTVTPDGEPESDVDPYEGIAPEELPPDLQNDADSSVSFPTNI